MMENVLMDESLPDAKSITVPKAREKLRRIVAQRNLCGLANDTKWDELIDAMRARTGWRPRFRCKRIDDAPWRWDGEWFYHLPFPLLSVEWLDLEFLQEIREHRQPTRVHVVDHSGWIEDLLRGIGLDYRKGARMIRIFGYSPRSLELFDEELPEGRVP